MEQRPDDFLNRAGLLAARLTTVVRYPTGTTSTSTSYWDRLAAALRLSPGDCQDMIYSLRRTGRLRVDAVGRATFQVREKASPSRAWMTDAACREVGVDLFYADGGQPHLAVRALCGECPVSGDCLDYALRRDEPYGVWGGKSRAERERIAAGMSAA